MTGNSALTDPAHGNLVSSLPVMECRALAFFALMYCAVLPITTLCLPLRWAGLRMPLSGADCVG